MFAVLLDRLNSLWDGMYTFCVRLFDCSVLRCLKYELKIPVFLRCFKDEEDIPMDLRSTAEYAQIMKLKRQKKQEQLNESRLHYGYKVR